MKKINIINNILNVLIIVMLIYLLIFYIFLKKDQEVLSPPDYTKAITKTIEGEYKYKNFVFTDANIIYLKENGTTISVNIKNNDKVNYFIKGLSAIIYDSNGKKVTVVYGSSSMYIDANDSVEYVLETKKDIVDSCTSIEYKLIYEVSKLEESNEEQQNDD